jgi:hypothetical protein
MMFLRLMQNGAVLGAALLAMGMFFVPVSAQAACNGGACPIVGGSLRTQVGGGFIIPQVPSASPFGAPTGQMHGTRNAARGAILPKLTGSPHINVPAGQVDGSPFSFSIPLGQLTYGSAPSNVPGPSGQPGHFSTPILVQVPIFGAVPLLFGVSTNIGQSFPGDVRWLPANVPIAAATTVIGGPAVLSAGGRSGASIVTNCAGAVIVPGSVPGTWTGGCNGGFTPSTGNPTIMATGTQAAPALMRYTKTTNQFGGIGSQRQVRRDATSTNNNWLGRINFNNQALPYTAAEMAASTTTSMQAPGAARKVYPTLPQNLVEPVAWGAGFGVRVQRAGATQGDLVSALLTFNGKPQNTSTVMITTVEPGQGGLGGGIIQTTTSWGGPLTTGMLTVQLNPTAATPPPETWAVTGSDNRDGSGNGYISLVSGAVAARNVSGPGTARTFLTLAVPEPAMAAGLVAGVLALAGLVRRRG